VTILRYVSQRDRKDVSMEVAAVGKRGAPERAVAAADRPEHVVRVGLEVGESTDDVEHAVLVDVPERDVAQPRRRRLATDPADDLLAEVAAALPELDDDLGEHPAPTNAGGSGELVEQTIAVEVDKIAREGTVLQAGGLEPLAGGQAPVHAVVDVRKEVVPTVRVEVGKREAVLPDDPVCGGLERPVTFAPEER